MHAVGNGLANCRVELAVNLHLLAYELHVNLDPIGGATERHAKVESFDDAGAGIGIQ